MDVNVSRRYQDSQTFEAWAAGGNEQALLEQALWYQEAGDECFVSWESSPITLRTGQGVRQVRKCYVLWRSRVPRSSFLDEVQIRMLLQHASHPHPTLSTPPASQEEARQPLAELQYAQEQPLLAPADSSVQENRHSEVAHGLRYQKTRHRGIARVDDVERGLQGYWVRFAWQRQHYAKFFSDRKAGSAINALVDAITWRDQTEQNVGKQTSRGVLRTPEFRASNTGIRGVTRYPSGERLMVRWRCNGKLMSTSVSIAKHGSEQAALRFAQSVLSRWQAEASRSHNELLGN